MILTIVKDIIPYVIKDAPLLASVLTGNYWKVGLSILANHFGVDPNNVDSLKNLIQGNDDSAEKIKECELNNKEALTQLSNESMQMQFQDVQSARDFSMKDNKTRVWLIRIALLGLILGITGLFFIPDADIQHLSTIIASVSIAELRRIYASEFGGKS